jgi:NAD+ synthase
MRTLDLSAEIDKIAIFISEYTLASGLSNIIIGLSGGIDSSLSAALAVKALGKEHVFGVMLPWKNSSPDSYNDALTLARKLGIQHERIEITPMVTPYFEIYEEHADNLRLGNWMARTRMCVLYDLSAKYKGLVLGTSNRTELLVGYFTQHGDGACAFEPIGHLYKTEVWQMAALLGVPQQIIDKIPTADLWANQTDEDEIGMKYTQLDAILYSLTEEHKTSEELLLSGIPQDKIYRVIDLMKRTEFKRLLPPLITEWNKQVKQ